MIYLPGSGIIAAYTYSKIGTVRSEFTQAVAIYVCLVHFEYSICYCCGPVAVGVVYRSIYPQYVLYFPALVL